MNFNPKDLLKLKDLPLNGSSNKMSSIQKLISAYSMTFREDKGSKLTIEEMDDNFHYLLENGGGSITGTPSGVLYFDDNGSVTSDSNFYHTSTGNLIGTQYYNLNYPQFIGSGVNDITIYIADPFLGPTSSIYTVTIAGTDGASPSSDRFDWTCNTGTTGSAVIDTTLQPLDNNLNIEFSTSSGHTIGDQWVISFQSTLVANIIGDVIGGKVAGTIAIGDDGIASVSIIGGSTLNNSYIGLLSLDDNNNQSNLQLESKDGVIFHASITSRNGMTYSTLRIEPDGITLESEQGFYSMPKNNNTGYLKSKGDGTTSWNVPGYSGTYSTGDNRIVTVTDGLITSVN